MTGPAFVQLDAGDVAQVRAATAVLADEVCQRVGVPTPAVAVVVRQLEHRRMSEPGYAWAYVEDQVVAVSIETALWPRDQVAAVLAHEIGHLQPDAVRRGRVANIAGAVAGVAWVALWAGIAYRSAIGWPVAAVGGLALFRLIMTWLTRRNELACDVFAAHAVGAAGYDMYSGQLGWLNWPRSRVLTQLFRPWMTHPWPPARMEAFRLHAAGEWCECPPAVRT